MTFKYETIADSMRQHVSHQEAGERFPTLWEWEGLVPGATDAPIRDARAVLVAEGRIESRGSRGYRVVDPNPAPEPQFSLAAELSKIRAALDRIASHIGQLPEAETAR